MITLGSTGIKNITWHTKYESNYEFVIIYHLHKKIKEATFDVFKYNSLSVTPFVTTNINKEAAEDIIKVLTQFLEDIK